MLLAILLRGSPSIFFVSFFLTFNLRHVPILHSNYTQIAPKWWVSILLQKSIFKMWPTFFVCGESPCVLIFFFSKICLQKIYLLPHFFIFFDGDLLQMKNKLISHISIFNICFTKKIRIFSKTNFKNRRRRNRTICLLTHVQNRFIFHLQVFPSKNIENWGRR